MARRQRLRSRLSVVRQTDRQLWIAAPPCDPLCPLWLKSWAFSPDTSGQPDRSTPSMLTISDSLHSLGQLETGQEISADVGQIQASLMRGGEN